MKLAGQNTPLMVQRQECAVDADALEDLVRKIDDRCGMFYGCDYHYAPVYRHESVAFIDPAILIDFERRVATIIPLNPVGHAIVQHWAAQIPGNWIDRRFVPDLSQLQLSASQHAFIHLLRALSRTFTGDVSGFGFYGAWSFDHWRLGNIATQRELDQTRVRLYMPTEILSSTGNRHSRITFTFPELEIRAAVFNPVAQRELERRAARRKDDFPQGGYANSVAKAVERLRAGEAMSLTLSQSFRREHRGRVYPAFSALRRRYPMPQMFFMNLHGNEKLIGASPDLQARASNSIVECAPVCGSARRGIDPLEDRDLGRALLLSEKEAASLGLSTDTLRSQLLTICEPGSVRLGMRQRIHFFESVIHSADYMTGTLAPDHDAWDILLATAAPPMISGVPLVEAVDVIESAESSPRGWYGGAIGYVGVDGELSLGTILRHAWFYDGIAEIRTGGVLVSHSEPDAEEEESRTKARALFRVLGFGDPDPTLAFSSPEPPLEPNAFAELPVALVTRWPDAFRPALRDLLWTLGISPTSTHTPLPDQINIIASTASALPETDLLAQIWNGSAPTIAVGSVATQLLLATGTKGSRLPVRKDGYVVSAKATPGEALATLKAFEAVIYTDTEIHAEMLTNEWIVLATDEEEIILAVRHASKPLVALLFRPDSALARNGVEAMAAGIRILLRSMQA